MSLGSSEFDEDVIIALASEEIENPKSRFWIHIINLKRETYGEVYHLFPNLVGDQEKFTVFESQTIKAVGTFGNFETFTNLEQEVEPLQNAGADYMQQAANGGKPHYQVILCLLND
ncbi:hypothetical protein NQ317_017361 [Molorchus minor]|uniref:Integron-associated effector binding protein domain-containing protein n=1 Tax=Molorchus minor TaxID=1323400 RepID=A0ABQ9J751_9CUCU|nr:hypothetical protein NQ317_017361 [Molorchus minor]